MDGIKIGDIVAYNKDGELYMIRSISPYMFQGKWISLTKLEEPNGVVHFDHHVRSIDFYNLYTPIDIENLTKLERLIYGL